MSFILVGETLIVMNYLGPMLAAVAHTVSSAIVVLNSARIVRYGEHIASFVPERRVEGDESAAGRVALQPV